MYDLIQSICQSSEFNAHFFFTPLLYCSGDTPSASASYISDAGEDTSRLRQRQAVPREVPHGSGRHNQPSAGGHGERENQPGYTLQKL